MIMKNLKIFILRKKFPKMIDKGHAKIKNLKKLSKLTSLL